VRRGIARRTRSIAAGVSVPSGWPPNITVPISQPRMPPSTIERHGQRLPGVLQRRDVRQQRRARRCRPRGRRPAAPRDAGALVEGVAQIGRRADPVAQVVVLHDLGEALGDGLEVAPGQTAVGREALGEDEQVAALRARASSFIASQPPMLARPSFLALMVMPSASAAMSRTMSRRCASAGRARARG
jgi:hypothetical protein